MNGINCFGRRKMYCNMLRGGISRNILEGRSTAAASNYPEYNPYKTRAIIPLHV